MLKPNMIPPEVVEALAMAWRDEMNSAHAIAAAINAWPGTVTNYSWDASHGRLILPLPQEVSDDA